MKKESVISIVSIGSHSGSHHQSSSHSEEQRGESYALIARYFIPEFITTLLVYTMPFWLDAMFVGALESVTAYTTLGIANNFIHTMMKLAEALSVGMVVMSGKYNGKKAYTDIGKTLVDAFWLTAIIGAFFASSLYFGASMIYRWYDVSEEVIALGVPFLRTRAVGVFCMFIYFALVGFLRGIKDTKTPMKIFLVGAFLFVAFDYMLIFGCFGFPKLGLLGSGIATCLQYVVMMVVSIWYIIRHKDIRRYSIQLLRPFTDFSYATYLVRLTIPIALDKTAMAFAYVWLSKMMTSISTSSGSAFFIVRDMERFAFIPAIAFAQVITFLVSNDVGSARWGSVKHNIKKVLLLSSGMVACFLLFFSAKALYISSFFDKTGFISGFASQAFPFISIFVFFDILQLILAGALRGTGNVSVVMLVRIGIFVFFFGPFSYALTHFVVLEEFSKFIALYSLFYISNALMTAAYVYCLSGDEWQKNDDKE
jgi:multidrug resistance protein, MATE family